MSVDLSKLVSRRKIALEELNGKAIAIDAFNVLYQFLSIIRGPDGTPLSDSKGNVTSHLSGLFYRTIELVDKGIKPIYVFDGIPSMLKQKTIEARMKRREDAFAAWQKAREAGEEEEARKHAMASTRINKYIIESSKELLGMMGIPFVNAPSEGEAEACYMCIRGIAYAAASQDYDTMLFGSPLVVRNLTMSGRRKLPGKNIFVNIEPEIMSLADTLKSLGVTRKQLVWIGILLGTDFNDGVKGVGPKTALKIVKSVKSLDGIEKYVKEKYDAVFEIDVKEVEDLFLKPEVSEKAAESVSGKLELQPDKQAVVDFMCDKHEFSKERVEKFVDRLMGKRSDTRQQRLF